MSPGRTDLRPEAARSTGESGGPGQQGELAPYGMPLTSTRPVIESIDVIASALIMVRWRHRSSPTSVRLDGWIRSGGPRRAVLLPPESLRLLCVSQSGDAVCWDCCEGAVLTALVLWQLAEEQRPFTNEDARAWQAATRLTNSEVAQLFGISSRTWRSYRAQARIPRSVGIACRAMTRDPLPLQAHVQLSRRLRTSSLSSVEG